MTDPAILWFRRDLRTGDHPALLAAAERGPDVLGLFVLDDELLRPSGAARRAYLYDCLRSLNDQLGGRLLVARGKPEQVLPDLVAEIGASSVHVTADCGPYGRRRDDKVKAAVGVDFVASGSPYAITPGRVLKQDGTPFRVFTPFYRAWLDHGWRTPADTDQDTVHWLKPPRRSEPIPTEQVPNLPPAGEQAARRQWAEFAAEGLTHYHEQRDRPDLPGSSRMSAHLKWGTIHPRTLLAELKGPGAQTYRSELAWREFHADVLWHQPRTARNNYDNRFDALAHDTGEQADEEFAAWCAGKTGYPLVDAGMRQLLTEGWMHNRVRMVVASFLVKDLHQPWWRGARHFMQHLIDGDLASNQLNWQWVAGSGTDAAPYFRIFNPTTQAEKFDPNGNYVRHYIPELRDLPGNQIHEPWKLKEGPPNNYPRPIVEHAVERKTALERYAEIKT